MNVILDPGRTVLNFPPYLAVTYNGIAYGPTDLLVEVGRDGNFSSEFSVKNPVLNYSEVQNNWPRS